MIHTSDSVATTIYNDALQFVIIANYPRFQILYPWLYTYIHVPDPVPNTIYTNSLQSVLTDSTVSQSVLIYIHISECVKCYISVPVASHSCFIFCARGCSSIFQGLYPWLSFCTHGCIHWCFRFKIQRQKQCYIHSCCRFCTWGYLYSSFKSCTDGHIFMFLILYP